MPVDLICKVDTTNLVRAMGILQQYSKYEPSETLHKTVAFVVHSAKDNTPFVEIGTIDTELEVVSEVRISTRGLNKGKPMRGNKKKIQILDPQIQRTFAVNIVLARMKTWSRYNMVTDWKYYINRAEFSPGMGKSGFWQRVVETARRMVSSRHSSTHFFQVSWNAILTKLIDYVPGDYKGAVSVWAGRGRPVIEDMGEVHPAVPGTPNAVCIIENRVGMDRQYPILDAIRNRAAHDILEPVLQSAIDREFTGKMQALATIGLRRKKQQLLPYGVILNG